MDAFIEHFTYAGIFLVLFAAGIGVPIPEEAVVLAAGAVSSIGTTRWWIALPVCVAGVLSGDIVLYWAGHHWGETILNWWIVRLVLSREREERLKAGYRRHAGKTIFAARHVLGVRAAAFLTAGIARVPFWRFLAVDAGAALISVPLGFTVAYFFTDELTDVLRDVRRVERWMALLGIVVAAVALAVIVWRRTRRVAEEP